MYIVETGAFGKGLVLDGKWQSSTADEFIYLDILPSRMGEGFLRLTT